MSAINRTPPEKLEELRRIVKLYGQEHVCATCRHKSPISMKIYSACIGCIRSGVCTKWEPAGGKENVQKV